MSRAAAQRSASHGCVRAVCRRARSASPSTMAMRTIASSLRRSSRRAALPATIFVATGFIGRRAHVERHGHRSRARRGRAPGPERARPRRFELPDAAARISALDKILAAAEVPRSGAAAGASARRSPKWPASRATPRPMMSEQQIRELRRFRRRESARTRSVIRSCARSTPMRARREIAASKDDAAGDHGGAGRTVRLSERPPGPGLRREPRRSW